jgi:hypothetical protein
VQHQTHRCDARLRFVDVPQQLGVYPKAVLRSTDLGGRVPQDGSSQFVKKFLRGHS